MPLKKEFQSTHPLRDATHVLERLGLLEKFQSTHPLRDATYTVKYNTWLIGISIHAPLTGCDLFLEEYILPVCIFQSTHPLRDATKPYLYTYEYRYNFNPRTPYGMRPQDLMKDLLLSIFQSTHPLRDATLIHVLQD